MKHCTSGDCSALLQKLTCLGRLKSNFAGIVQNPALASQYYSILVVLSYQIISFFVLFIFLHSPRILSMLPALLIFVTVLRFGGGVFFPRQCSGRAACTSCCVWLEASRDRATRNTNALGKQPMCTFKKETPAADPCHAKKGFFYHLLLHQWMRDRRPFQRIVIKIEKNTQRCER